VISSIRDRADAAITLAAAEQTKPKKQQKYIPQVDVAAEMVNFANVSSQPPPPPPPPPPPESVVLSMLASRFDAGFFAVFVRARAERRSHEGIGATGVGARDAVQL
jgi:hypothetical protein